MEAHIGADAKSGLVSTVTGTATNVNDVTQGMALLHGDESDAFGDAGYQGVAKRGDTADVAFVAIRPDKRRTLEPDRKQHVLSTRSSAPRRAYVPRSSTLSE